MSPARQWQYIYIILALERQMKAMSLSSQRSTVSGKKIKGGGGGRKKEKGEEEKKGRRGREEEKGGEGEGMLP